MDYGDFTVVLPTLNEAGTIGKLIGSILKDYRGAKVIVVDDGSNDGTRRIVDALSRSNKGVRFVDRRGKAKGLTASVIDGIWMSRTRWAIVMDADMQHPPEVLKRIAEMLRRGDDVVVATRAKVPGWELERKVISKVLIYFGYAVLSAEGAQTSGDIFSGYFGVRRDLFMKVYSANKARFIGSGYKVLFDLLKCIKKGSVRLSDVPFTFQTRRSGQSKAGAVQGLALLKSFLS